VRWVYFALAGFNDIWHSRLGSASVTPGPSRLTVCTEQWPAYRSKFIGNKELVKAAGLAPSPALTLA
jgi:hypothetical protein